MPPSIIGERGQFPQETGGLNDQITNCEGHLPIVGCVVVCFGQTGGGVDSEVRLLGKVEDYDVIVQVKFPKLWVNNDLFHLDVLLGQISFILLFPVVFSKGDLI